jgi:hypothetical protein
LFCICSQVFAVPPNAFSKRIAVAALMDAFSLTMLFRAWG